MVIQKIGRNDLCPCGSGRKYKQCCQQQDQAQAAHASAQNAALAQALREGLAHHQAGRLAQAEAAYRQILQSAPNHADALHFTGVLAHQSGQHRAAVEMIGKAIAVTPCAPMFCNLGLAFQALGELDRAIESFRQALAHQPIYAEARNNLGFALQEQGKLLEAVDNYRQALAIRPDYAEAHGNLGLALQTQNKIDEAVAHYRRALACNSALPEIHSNLGSALQAQDNLEQAVQCYRQALALNPAFAKAHNNLGSVWQAQGQLEMAIECYRQALNLAPDFAKAHRNLADTLCELKQFDRAIEHYGQALRITPDCADTCRSLGMALYHCGRFDAAIEQHRKALALQPDDARTHNDLGIALQAQGRLQMAIDCYQGALSLAPGFAMAHNNLGNALKEQGQLSPAIESYRQALTCQPDYVNAHNNLGMAWLELGDLDSALASFRHALVLQPENLEIHSNLLFALNFDANGQPAEYLAEARRYGAKVQARAQPYADWNTHASAQRLKVGLVSGDLRTHPVGFFLESVLARLNPERIELVAYSTRAQEDDLTQRIKPYFSAWHSIAGLDDASAARKIHDHGIDILIDLAGHTAHNRLPVFAWKPAPVQASWLGYFASTGVPEIDYLLADPTSAPQQTGFTETVRWLPDTRLCFTPPQTSDAPAPLPALKNGHVTFGSFQHVSKLNEAVLAVWTRILHALPQARLRLQNKQLGDPVLRATLQRRLAQAGIGLERITLEGPVARSAYLAAHAEVDMILDTFPYPGGTTTCEALWMGVPTLTLAGNTLLARQGASLLTCAGLHDWIARDIDDYIARAQIHASDLDRLAQLRGGLRQQAQTSPLFDAPRFAQALENALWGMRHASMSPEVNAQPALSPSLVNH